MLVHPTSLTHFRRFSLSLYLRTSQAPQRWTRKGSSEKQRRLVSLLSSHLPHFLVSCTHFSPHFRRFSLSLDLRTSQALQRWTRKGSNEKQRRRLVSLLCSFIPPVSLPWFLYTFSPHFHHFSLSLDLRMSQAPQRWMRKESDEKQRRLVSLLCLFTPPPSLSWFLYTFSPHFHHFRLDLRMSQAPQRWTRKGSDEKQRRLVSCCAHSPHLPHSLGSCTHFHLTFVVSGWT